MASGLAIRKPRFDSQLHYKLHDSGPVSQALELHLSIMDTMEDPPLRTRIGTSPRVFQIHQRVLKQRYSTEGTTRARLP